MLSVMTSLPLLGCAGSTGDTARYNLDSVKRTCSDEIACIIDHIENTYISGRRGIDDEEWNKNKSIIYNRLQNFFDKRLCSRYANCIVCGLIQE